jgi:hypothetical protein
MNTPAAPGHCTPTAPARPETAPDTHEATTRDTNRAQYRQRLHRAARAPECQSYYYVKIGLTET